MAIAKVVVNGVTRIDASQTTVTPDTLMKGVTALAADGTIIEGNISTGVEPKAVNFWDYDGTCLYSYTRSEFLSRSALPSYPQHGGLTAQGWNWTLAEIQQQLSDVPSGDVNVGQMYTTKSGATEIDINLDDSNYLSPYLFLAPNGTLSINWGDGSSAETMTGSGINTRKSLSHTYPQTGAYTIKISPVNSATYAIINSSTAYASILQHGSDNTSSSNYPRVYSSCIRAIRVGNNCSLGSNAFAGLYNCKYITMPSSLGLTATNVTSLFYYCPSLKNIIIPRGLNSTSNSNMFYYDGGLVTVCLPVSWRAFYMYECHTLMTLTIPYGTTSLGSFGYDFCLRKLVLPSTVTSIGSHSNNYSLRSFNIPSGVTSLVSSQFSACYSLTSLTIPSSVTSIGTSAFGSCYSMQEYHFRGTTPPTITSTNVFGSIQSTCKIYVPAASLSTYQTADYWSTYASYMVGE